MRRLKLRFSRAAAALTDRTRSGAIDRCRIVGKHFAMISKPKQHASPVWQLRLVLAFDACRGEFDRFRRRRRDAATYGMTNTEPLANQILRAIQPINALPLNLRSRVPDHVAQMSVRVPFSCRAMSDTPR